MPINLLRTALFVIAILLVSSVLAKPLLLQPRIHVSAPHLELTTDAQNWLKNNHTIKVGVWGPSQPPIGDGMERGVYQGIAADYLDLLQNALQIKVELHYYQDSRDAIAALSRREIAMFATWNPQRWPTSVVKETFPWLLDGAVLLHRHDKQASLTLGKVTDDFKHDMLQKAFPNSRLITFKRYSEAVNAASQGYVDSVWINRATADYLLQAIQPGNVVTTPINQLNDLSLSFGVDAQLPQLTLAINQVLQKLPLNSRLEIVRGWGLDHQAVMMNNALGLNFAERQWLNRHKQIRILLPARNAPLSFTDNNGKPQGLIVDVLNEITLRYNVNFSFAVWQTAKEHALLQQRFPDSLSAPVWLFPKPEEADKTSMPVLDSPMVVMMNTSTPAVSNFDQLKGERIALEQDNPIIPWLETWYPTLNLEITPNLTDAMDLLHQNRVRAVIAPQFVAQYLQSINKVQLAVTVPISDVNLVFSTSITNNPALSIIDNALRSITPQSMFTLVAPWHRQQLLPRLIQQNIGMAISLALLLLVTLVASVLWIRRLRRQLSQGQKAQCALHDQLLFTQTLIDHAPVALYVRDNSGRLLKFNQAWADTVKRSGDTMLGKNVTGLDSMSFNARQQLEQQYQHALSYGEQFNWSGPFEFDGETHYLAGWTVPWSDRDGQTNGLIGGWLDVTERENLLSALSHAKSQLEQANLSKSTFMRTMSHEVRTPLNSIIGLLEIELQSVSAKDKANENMRLIWESACNLVSLIGDLFDVYRSDEEQVQGTIRSVNLEQLIHSTIALYQKKAEEQGVTINVETALKQDRFELDSLFIIRIFSSLLRNAMKHGHGESITVALLQGRNAHDNELAQLVLEISNDGALSRNLHTSSKEEAETFALSDTGISLAACQRLAAQHNATLSIESDADTGTVVSLHFSALPSASLTTGRLAIDSASLHVLIVDDYQPGRHALKQRLSSWGITVEEAENGKQALDRYLEQPEYWDLVITDCTMPEMDGFTLTRKLRSTEQSSQRTNLKIFGLTALTDFSTTTEGLAAGMNECLVKPISPQGLQSILQRYFPDVIGQLILNDDLESFRKKLLIQEMIRLHIEEKKSLLLALEYRDNNALMLQAHRLRGGASLIQDQDFIKHCEVVEQVCQQHSDWVTITDKVEMLVIYMDLFVENNTSN